MSNAVDPISFLKSPMILMALVSLVMIVGVPYLTDNSKQPVSCLRFWYFVALTCPCF